MLFLLSLLLFLALLRAYQGMHSNQNLIDDIQKKRSEAPGPFAPRAVVLAPCKGAESGLRDRMRALLTQAYPEYEVVFVFESEDDPAVAVIRELMNDMDVQPTATRTEMVFAGPCTDSGQKVHNLTVGLQHISADVTVYAFMDSDAYPEADWLRHLVAPLEDETVGVTTGYRIYLPERGGLASSVLHDWNAVTLTVLANPKWGFAWGGSMAVRRETFDAIDVRSYWQGSVSDDYGVTRAVRDAKLNIRFVPQCLVRSPQDVSWPQLWEFVCRQYIITRTYAPKLWLAALAVNLLYIIGLFVAPFFLIPSGGIIPEIAAIVLWMLVLFAGRQRSTITELEATTHTPIPYLYTMFGAPFLPLFNTLALLNAAFTRRITWRGITYDLHGMNRMTVVKRHDRG